MRQPSIQIAILAILPFLVATSPISAKAAQRGGRGQAPAGPDIPIPRMPDGTPNLGWEDPSYKGAWRSGMHWEYGKDQLDPKAREEGLPY